MPQNDTKKATRDYRAYSSTPWGLWDTMYRRRSHRKYLPFDLNGDIAKTLENAVEISTGVRGARPEHVLPVTDKASVEEIRKRCRKGLANKINLWLGRQPLSGFIVLALPREDLKSERPAALAKASMAAEDCVLVATEEGIGSCWLGGVNQGEVREIMGLGKEIAVPIIISLGKPKIETVGPSIDSIMYQTISRKRKPLSEIASVETIGRPYEVKDIERGEFSAAEAQSVLGLLAVMSNHPARDGGAGAELIVDSCLESGRIAPSASNAQPWNFVVVREKVGELATLCGAAGAWEMAIVVTGRGESWASRFMEKPFWMIDLPIAISHISLMATSMGRAVDVAIDDISENEINRLVGLESGMRTAGVVGIG